MQSIRTAIMTALQTSTALTTLLGTGTRIFFHYPSDIDADKFPRITYFELGNFGNLFADDVEAGSEIDYQIDVWSKASTTAISLVVDTIMTGLDFTRQSSQDLYEKENKIYHKAMTYRLDYQDPDS
jgi:hypothetical protein